MITADRRLDGYRTTPNQQGIRNVAVYSDGSVALINSAAVSLYFPFTGTLRGGRCRQSGERMMVTTVSLLLDLVLLGLLV